MPKNSCIMQIWAEPKKSALPICNYSQILYRFLTFTQNLKRSRLSSQSDNPEPLGKTAIYKYDFPALLNQRVLKITAIKLEMVELLYYFINSYYFHYNVSHQGGGSAQANLKLEHVLNMMIPLPPLEEQHRIVAKIEELLPYCNQIIKR